MYNTLYYTIQDRESNDASLSNPPYWYHCCRLRGSTITQREVDSVGFPQLDSNAEAVCSIA